MTIDELKNILYQDLKTSSPTLRRSQLIDEMAKLTNKKIDCYNCTGTCCTMSANSMQITPLEAVEILLSLELDTNNCNELKTKLKNNITQYRLDHEISLGKKALTNLRKTYTCPFFVPGSKGCTIKKELKPYGCLGFNPRIENDNGSNCHSDFSLLETREKSNVENEFLANQFLFEKLNLNWKKLEIPKAVLSLIESLETRHS